MKFYISLSVLIFSSIGGWIGQVMDHGNWLGGWSILFGSVGAFFGIWAGYKAGRYLGA